MCYKHISKNPISAKLMNRYESKGIEVNPPRSLPFSWQTLLITSVGDISKEQCKLQNIHKNNKEYLLCQELIGIIRLRKKQLSHLKYLRDLRFIIINLRKQNKPQKAAYISSQGKAQHSHLSHDNLFIVKSGDIMVYIKFFILCV